MNINYIVSFDEKLRLNTVPPLFYSSFRRPIYIYYIFFLRRDPATQFHIIIYRPRRRRRRCENK